MINSLVTFTNYSKLFNVLDQLMWLIRVCQCAKSHKVQAPLCSAHNDMNYDFSINIVITYSTYIPKITRLHFCKEL